MHRRALEIFRDLDETVEVCHARFRAQEMNERAVGGEPAGMTSP